MRPFTSWFRSDNQPATKSSVTADTNDEDFYSLQSGRWLWDEQMQRDKHYRRFDVSALQHIAISSVRAKRCVSMNKISDIGGNKVFRLAMDNRKVVIAKIPHERAASGSLRVASEAATMDFASRILGIPVPKVLAWNAKEDSPVGAEYIVMEEASGILLDACWDRTEPDSQAEILSQLASMSAKFQSVSFSSIGNIYFATDNIPGSSPAIVDGPLPPNLKAKIRQHYTIGPTVDHSYWRDGRAKIAGVQGPWSDPKDWLNAIVRRETTWLEKYAVERKQLPLMPPPEGTRADHIELWKKFGAATDFLSSISPQFLRPTLWHADVCATNIFVKKNKVTAIIDWEGSWVTPLIFAVQQPQMLMPKYGMVLELPNLQQVASLPEGPEKAKIMKSFVWQYLRYAYETALQQSSPTFEQLEQIPLLSTLQQLVLQAMDTWTDGAVPLRGCLITLLKHWEQVCPNRPCPYQFTQDEIEKHAIEQRINGLISMLVFMSHDVMRGDGRVRREEYQQVFEMFAQFREDALVNLKGNERDEMAAALAWTIRPEAGNVAKVQ